MQDGHTTRLPRAEMHGRLYLDRHRVTLVVLEGANAGHEYIIGEGGLTIGRGPDVDVAIADRAMSKRHAAFELAGEGFRVRDLGSTNGLGVNGSLVAAADLKHGDRVALGEHVFQYIVEESDDVPTYDLSDD